MALVGQYGIYNCITKPEIKSFNYTWSITNLWDLIESGSQLYSSRFENNYLFCLSIDNNMKFYMETETSFMASYSIYLRTDEKDIIITRKSIQKISNNKLLCETSLPKNSNGILNIVFKFNIFVDWHNYHVDHPISITPSQLKETDSVVPKKCNSQLVTFVINEKQLEINKDLLCSNSTVFEAMFRSNFKETIDNKINIIDISYNTLKKLLSFLQNGYLSENMKADVEALRELFITAEKYDIKDLKLVCEELLIWNTTIKNVIEHLSIAYLNGGEILEQYAIEFIKLYFEDIEDNAEFKTLVQKYPKLLIKIRNVSLLKSETYMLDVSMDLT